jgi:NADPH:quinone reductase-like Zn-dependent oxidoreductase
MATPTRAVSRLADRDGFSGIEAHTESIPTLLPHEVLIKVRALALNYRDIAIATSRYPSAVKDNVIPGSDMTGEIVRIGNAVSKGAEEVQAGDNVVVPIDWACRYGSVKDVSQTLGGPVDGVLREYIALPAHLLIRVPSPSQKFELEPWLALVTTA